MRTVLLAVCDLLKMALFISKRLKLVLLGNYSVGKRSIRERFVTNHANDNAAIAPNGGFSRL